MSFSSGANTLTSSSSMSNNIYSVATNGVLSTKQNMKMLIDEIETLAKELILQTTSSNKPKGPNEPNIDLVELTKILVQKQTELNKFCDIAIEQQIMHEKINKVKSALANTDYHIKCLITYLKEAEQLLTSAIYQSKMKLNMIKSAKPLSVEEIINYAHKISSDNAVCCPENWNIDNPKRPYPTDADMRRGWLARISMPDANQPQDEELSPKRVNRSNSQIINPIVPNDFGYKDNKDTEYMSESSDSSSDGDTN